MSHVLVTNDFPPKHGGIQAYLWDLWKRLDAERYWVLTASSHPDHRAFDEARSAEGIRIERRPEPVLLPTPAVVKACRAVVERMGAELVVIDPAVPLGLIGPRLGVPYAAVLHGAEVTVPGRLPVARDLLAWVLREARLVISAGEYAAEEARRATGALLPRVVSVPPGVDCSRFVPIDPSRRAAERHRLGLPPTGPLVVSVSRLVPRKGMDVLIDAAARLAPMFPDLCVAIGGAGRLSGKLAHQVEATGAPVRLLGRIDDEDLPVLLGVSDVFVMACRDRWGGLEQEGFGVVFLEAAAAGVPQVAGRSGGSHEAVVDGVTGIVVDRPTDAGEVAFAVRRLLADETLRTRLGSSSRARVVQSFADTLLAPRLGEALAEVGG